MDTDLKKSERLTILCGDALEKLRGISDASVQCCVTSPPYFGLRDYGVDGQIGLEKSPQEYVGKLVALFREVRRVLKDDGTLWLNLGDSFAGGATGKVENKSTLQGGKETQIEAFRRPSKIGNGYKPKDLMGIPWRVAFALQSDGWYLRSDIVWVKKNCMPESVLDRPTRSHEFIFLFAKSKTYFYDAEAIKEPCIYDVDGTGTQARKMRQTEGNKSNPTNDRAGIRMGYKNSVNFNGKNNGKEKQRGHSRKHAGFNARWDHMEKSEQCSGLRNKRDVWTVAPAQYPESHFATFPPALIKPCIMAGSRPGDLVLDPFGGSGTTGLVALELGRKALLIELNPKYIPLIEKRTNVTPGLDLATD